MIVLSYCHVADTVRHVLRTCRESCELIKFAHVSKFSAGLRCTTQRAFWQIFGQSEKHALQKRQHILPAQRTPKSSDSTWPKQQVCVSPDLRLGFSSTSRPPGGLTGAAQFVYTGMCWRSTYLIPCTAVASEAGRKYTQVALGA